MRELYDLCDIIDEPDRDIRNNMLIEWRQRCIHTLYSRASMSYFDLETSKGMLQQVKERAARALAEKVYNEIEPVIKDAVAFPGKSITYCIAILKDGINGKPDTRGQDTRTS